MSLTLLVLLLGIECIAKAERIFLVVSVAEIRQRENFAHIKEEPLAHGISIERLPTAFYEFYRPVG